MEKTWKKGPILHHGYYWIKICIHPNYPDYLSSYTYVIKWLSRGDTPKGEWEGPLQHIDYEKAEGWL